jgi:pimeloyl-ACP methyl ester carboxylesterase
MKSTQTKPSIVFCHGIWADGSCFNKVIPTLQAEGHQVIAAQYGLDTLAGDVTTVRRTLRRVSSPAILVGHSYGGSVITAAGTDDRVTGLVYIAALAPDADETRKASRKSFPSQTFSPTSKSRMGECGCSPTAPSASPATCLSRRRKSSGQLTLRRLRTCSHRSLMVLPGDRSPVRTSWPRTTAQSNPSCNGSSRSAWAPPRRRSPAATFPCYPTPSS